MSQRIPSAVVVGAIGLAFWGTGSLLHAAEYRTSVRGQPITRQAAYQVVEAPPEPNPAPTATPHANSNSQSVLSPDSTLPNSTEFSEPYLEPLRTGPRADCVDSNWSGSCGPEYCGPCAGWTYWGSFEFLLWWRKSQEFPPLVTTSPDGTAVDAAGVLGAPNTQVLYPTESQNNNARAGGRLTLGVWFDSCEFTGLGARLYSLGETTATFDADSDTYAILARPFYNWTLARNDADLVAYPAATTGSISVSNTARVGGGDVFFRRLLCRDDCRRLDLIAGYQFAKIDSDLLITSDRRTRLTDAGTTIQMYDLFDTTNRYHAGEIGFLGEYDGSDITWSLLAKVGLGSMQQRTEIAGSTMVTVSGQPAVVTDQGLLALGTNSGIYAQNKFTVSPELQLTAAYHLTDNIDLTVGYSFIYWNHVAQPGPQIDEVLNTSQINGALVGDPRPAYPNRDSDFFVQGMSVGIQWIW
ncbi:MAG: BBP7 family outer membrane beta-barrel protein [Pirellulaceae bacterium]